MRLENVDLSRLSLVFQDGRAQGFLLDGKPCKVARMFDDRCRDVLRDDEAMRELVYSTIPEPRTDRRGALRGMLYPQVYVLVEFEAPTQRGARGGVLVPPSAPARVTAPPGA